MTEQDGFTEGEFYRAWSLVENGIEYTQKELSSLDPQQRRIVWLADVLRAWRAKLPVSESSRRFQQEIKARYRRRRRAFYEWKRVLKEYLLSPECGPEESREILEILTTDWRGYFAESERQRRNAHPGKLRTDALQQLIEGIIPETPKLT